MKIDETDRSIINALIDNSRLSYRQIAKKTDVSTATVMNRVNALERERIIKRHTTIVDYEKIGYDVEVLIDIRIAKGKLMEVEKKIAIDPHVCGVYDTTGEFDAVILARFENRRKMDNFLKKIQTYDFVERTNTKLVLNTVKESQIRV